MQPSSSEMSCASSSLRFSIPVAMRAKVLRPLARAHPRPRPLVEGPAGRGDRVVDVGPRRGGNTSDRSSERGEMTSNDRSDLAARQAPSMKKEVCSII